MHLYVAFVLAGIVIVTVIPAILKNDSSFTALMLLIGTLLAVFSIITTSILTVEYNYERARGCELTSTNRTVFADCKDRTAKSSNHFINENYKDSMKVGVYLKKKSNDVFGNTKTELVIRETK